MKVRPDVGDLVVVTWPNGTLGMSTIHGNNFEIPRGEIGLVVEIVSPGLIGALWAHYGVMSVVSSHVTVIDV